MLYIVFKPFTLFNTKKITISFLSITIILRLGGLVNTNIPFCKLPSARRFLNTP